MNWKIADEDENETCDQTKQNARQVSLYYVAQGGLEPSLHDHSS